MGTVTKKFDRKFLGKVKDFESIDEQRLENKHLKAYLKGYEKFTYGFTHQENPITKKMEAIPTWHEVKSELITL